MKTLGEAGGKYFMNKNLIVPGAPLAKEFEELKCSIRKAER